MNRPDSNDPRSADPPPAFSANDRPPLESRLRATPPRPARFGPDELASGISPAISASRSPSAAGHNLSTRAWWCAVAASWLGGMVMGASAWQALRGGESRLETVSELGPPADRNASDADPATATPTDRYRSPNPDTDTDRPRRPADRFVASRHADSRPIEVSPNGWADLLTAGEPLRARNVRRPGPGTPRRPPVTPRPESLEIDRRTTDPADANPFGQTAPAVRNPAINSGGLFQEERPPLTPAAYRGRLRQPLMPSAIERL